MVKITNLLIKPLLLSLIIIAIICGFSLQYTEMPDLNGSLVFFLFAGISIALYITIHMLLMKIIELKNG